ncbi:hypothetical protein K2173_028260 [Erythroxylum novogranatense]|uniref:Glutaredoxin domain-containing protein n=1 Tax=Erythroxylum novogranatense TaxID=1862640 RepID=A0AAV8U1L9_9ROSI|nr:hypothetical protein K2173_028260 [Erythroxylum novogranatense]
MASQSVNALLSGGMSWARMPSSSSSSSATSLSLGLQRNITKVSVASPWPLFKPPTDRLHFISKTRSSIRCALSPELKSTLDKVVSTQKVILFMKGTKEFPQCGFSNTVVQILNSLNVPFETINILENELLRQGLKEYSNWPTFPQLYIEGEFFGGCDITVEAYKNGELQELLEKAMCS